MLYPIKLSPIFKDYLWGGEKLRTDFNKQSELNIIAESWELSCHKDGESTVVGGEYDGLTLTKYIESVGNAVLGKACEKFDNFPILIKLIDAKDNLSVQVHPDNDYALRVEGEYGKTEMWYVVDCDKDAELIYGFRDTISKQEFEEHIKNNTLLDVVNRVPVKKGDVFFIKSGTLHAIGKGILIAEIQQNSNTTYRVYDYGRVGADGKPRMLHIEKAIEVTSLKPTEKYEKSEVMMHEGAEEELLARCEYFCTKLFKVQKSITLSADDTSFLHLLILDGNAKLGLLSVTKGDSVFVPAGYGKLVIEGKCDFILTSVE